MKISIIVPVYNAERYLKACVDSLTTQTYRDVEIILINDGSTDNSPVICDQLAQQDQRIKVVHSANKGVSMARNTGVEMSTGDFVTFVDSDDWIDSDIVEIAVRRLKDDAVDLLIYGMVIDHHIDDVVQRSDRKEIAQELHLDDQALREHFAYLYKQDYLSSSCTKFFSRKIIVDNGLRFDSLLVCYEDFSFVLDYMRHCGSILAIADIKYHYRMDMSVVSINKRSQANLYDNFHRVCKNLADFACKLWGPSIPSEVWNIIYELYLNIIYKLFVSTPPMSMMHKYQQIRQLINTGLFLLSAQRSQSVVQSTRFYKVLNFAIRHKLSLIVYSLYSKMYR